jgi:hypothetical protein
LHPVICSYSQWINLFSTREAWVQVDWSDADIVFANATCFDDVLFGNLEVQLTSLTASLDCFISFFGFENYKLSYLYSDLSYITASGPVTCIRLDTYSQNIPRM